MPIMTTPDEESFPRGGSFHPGKKRKHSEVKDKDLFRSRHEDEAPKSKKKKKNRHVTLQMQVAEKKKKEKKNTAQIKSKLSEPVVLSAKACSSGMLILGVIKSVGNYHLDISLPNGNSGRVPITAICDAYTESLKRLAKGDFNVENVESLNKLFRTGMIVRCKVTDIETDKKGRPKINLSINPRDLNICLTPLALKNGMVLTGCVSSCEDHGYIIDLGVKGIYAFLKKSEAEDYIQDYNEGEPLYVGSLLHCKVTCEDQMEMIAGESRSIQLTINPRDVFRSDVKKSMGIKMNTLQPGMRAEVTVKKIFGMGVAVEFLSYAGAIHQTHLNQNPSKVEQGQKLTACVLYIHPVTKVVSFTCLPHLVTPDLAPRNLFGTTKVNDILQEVRVFKVDPKRGIFVKIDDQTLGFASVPNLSDTAVKDVTREFPKGSFVMCRVMDLDYCDKLLRVSLKKSILERTILKYDDLIPGSDLECEVKSVMQAGVTVQLSSNMKGFIPATHLADIPLKHPEKRFKTGTKINCRVLAVNPEEKSVIMTAKKSLLTSKYPKITEYDEVTEGMIVEGTANKITDKGVRVLFYNNVTGFVPNSYLADEPVADPSKVFYVGQVIRGKVIKSRPGIQKMIISLKSTEEDKKQKRTETPVDLEVGMIVKGVIKTKTARGFMVGIDSTETTGFLPNEHLSNYLQNAKYLADLYQTGDVIEELMIFNISKQVYLTKKDNFLSAAKDEALPKQFDDLKLGSNVPGVVRNHKDYGVFVELPNGLIGLTPHKYMCDVHTANTTQLHQVGQSVIGKVTEVDQEKSRFLLSLRLKDCYHGDLNEGIALLTEYLEEMDYIMEYYKKQKKTEVLASHSTGDIVAVTVSKVTNQGVICSLPDGTKAVATEDHIREVKCEKGSKFEALVLFVDIDAECVEVSLNTSLVRSVKNLADSKFTKARVGQTIKSEVLLIKDDFVLIALKGHAHGRLAYLPSKLHLNDMLERRQYEITQENGVVIKSLRGDRIMASLQIHEPAEKKGEVGIGHNLRPGMITKARVKQVLPFQLNISIGDVSGRVHVSEIAKNVQEGTSPLDGFKQDQELKAKVIGFRELKTNKYLPVTHSKICKALPECTVVPNKVKSEGLLVSEDIHKSSFSVGNKVTAYVQMFTGDILWVQVSPKFRGKIKKSHISDDESVRNSPLDHFLVGKGYTAHVTGPSKANVLPLSLKGELPTDSTCGVKKEVKEGVVLTGKVINSTSRGLIVRLSPQNRGRVAPTDFSDTYITHPWKKYSEDDEVTVYVINTDDPNKCVLSLRNSRVKTSKRSKRKVEDPELALEDLVEGKIVRGYITKVSKKHAFVTLARDIAGRFDTDSKRKVEEGQLVRCQITKVEEEKKMVSLALVVEDEDAEPDSSDEEAQADTAELGKARKRKVSDGSDTGVSHPSPRSGSTKRSKADEDIASSSEDEDTDLQKQGETSALSAPRLSLSAGFSWDSELSMPKSANLMRLDSDSDDDDEDDQKDKPSSRKTRQEKLAAQREEERRIVMREQQLIDENHMPESAEDFDRLVLQSPDSSLVWLRYMAFHLEITEIEQARAVAERALKTISFREEQEKLNVWVAYMNLENMYGTTDTLKAVFDRAVQHNEPHTVYSQLVNIYEKSNKEEAAELLYNTMIRKFSASKDVWISFGLFYFKHNKPKSAQKLMQRGLNSLDSKHHVEVLSKFAQMEFKYGEPERGRTMFENILSSYPKRTDLWSVYIDMMVKQGDMQQVRNLFERVVSQNFSARKMKFFFKKQLDFEQKYGTEETVGTVKQKAVAYVEARESLT